MQCPNKRFTFQFQALSDHREKEAAQSLSASNLVTNSTASGVQRQSADSDSQPTVANANANAGTTKSSYTILNMRDGLSSKPVPVGSPPMECDSSVPSPPKATPAVITPKNSPVSPVKQTKESKSSYELEKVKEKL